MVGDTNIKGVDLGCRDSVALMLGSVSVSYIVIIMEVEKMQEGGEGEEEVEEKAVVTSR